MCLPKKSSLEHDQCLHYICASHFPISQREQKRLNGSSVLDILFKFIFTQCSFYFVQTKYRVLLLQNTRWFDKEFTMTHVSWVYNGHWDNYILYNSNHTNHGVRFKETFGYLLWLNACETLTSGITFISTKCEWHAWIARISQINSLDDKLRYEWNFIAIVFLSFVVLCYLKKLYAIEFSWRMCLSAVMKIQFNVTNIWIDFFYHINSLNLSIYVFNNVFFKTKMRCSRTSSKDVYGCFCFVYDELQDSKDFLNMNW